MYTKPSLEPRVQVLYSTDFYFQKIRDYVIEENEVSILEILLSKYQDQIIENIKDLCGAEDEGGLRVTSELKNYGRRESVRITDMKTFFARRDTLHPYAK